MLGPVGGVFAPFFQRFDVAFLYIVYFECGFKHCRVAANGVQFHTGFFKLASCNGEFVGENSSHSGNFTSGISNGFACFQAAATGRNEVFNHHYALSCFKIAFDKIFQSVVFWA